MTAAVTRRPHTRRRLAANSNPTRRKPCTTRASKPRSPFLRTPVRHTRTAPWLRDPELIAELRAIEDPRRREEFAIAALRIGMLSLRTVRGQVDVRAVRDEVERMLLELRKGLDEHRDRVGHDVTSVLREYFDPKDGRFAERVQRLVEDDGELARVIKGHVEGSDSALSQTLARHVGADSALLRTLDPNSSEGIVAGITKLVDDALGGQRKAILGEFSLDNREGALARLVEELKGSHGKLGDALQERIGEVVREFSLDDENSALSRLVHRVERAQQQITEEFTLDSETSALARLRRELMANATQMSENFSEFQKKVEVELGKLAATRAANAKSTAHGHEFQGALLGWLERRAQEAGDIFEDTRQHDRRDPTLQGGRRGDRTRPRTPRRGRAHRRRGEGRRELPPRRRARGDRDRAQEPPRRGRSLRGIGAHRARRLGTLPRDRPRSLRRLGRRRSRHRRLPRSRARAVARALHARPAGRPPADRLRRLRPLDPLGGEAARGTRRDPAAARRRSRAAPRRSRNARAS